MLRLATRLWCAPLPSLRAGATRLCGAARQMSIHVMTRLSVIDNTGAKEIQCIGHVARRNPATLGDAIRAVVKSARPDGKVSRKDIVAAVVVRQRRRHQRRDGTTIRFHENAAVLLKRDMSGPLGTKVYGPVARELRANKFMKVVLMASRAV
jgi:large subunit ribosomal protein L14